MAIDCKHELGGYCNLHTTAFCDAGCVLYREGATCSDRKPRKKKIVYLAGKMTGLPDYGRARFNAKAEELTEAGYIVLNPATLPVGLRHESYMKLSFAMLDAADAIYLLNNWRDSPGAHLAHEYAVYQHKKIIYEEGDEEEQSKAEAEWVLTGYSLGTPGFLDPGPLYAYYQCTSCFREMRCSSYMPPVTCPFCGAHMKNGIQSNDTEGDENENQT